METTRELLESALALRNDGHVKRILDTLKADREGTVKKLIHASGQTEYERAVMAGRIQQTDELLRLFETTPEDLDNFKTR